MTYNNLTSLPEGIFDNLPLLNYVDGRYNSEDDEAKITYVTNSWEFCNKLSLEDITLNGIEVRKNFKQSTNIKEFCANKEVNHHQCQNQGNGILSCPAYYGNFICDLYETNFDKMLVDFPGSKRTIDDFHEAGEDNDFFAQFNFDPQNKEAAK